MPDLSFQIDGARAVPYSVSPLLGFGLRRRRKLVSLLMVLMVAALTLTASGCAGLQMNGTPAGTYKFTVGATGAGTGTSESQTFTLTVTQ